MACVALTSLMETIELEFLQPIPRVSRHDRATMESLYKKLFSLQAFVNETNALCAAIRDLETEIRDFALKAEDHIEIQLSNFLLAEDREHEEKASRELLQTLRGAADNASELLRILNNSTSGKVDEAKDKEFQEKASQELHQSLREAAENTIELLKIINKEKEHKRQREKASIALTSLRSRIELIFLQPIPGESVSHHDDQASIKSFLENLSSLQAFLNEANDLGNATKIIDFAFIAEDDILGNLIFVKHSEQASQELHQSLQQAAENAAELLKIIKNTSKEADSANETQPLIPWLKHAYESVNVKSDGSLRCSPKLEDRMVGRQNDITVIKDQLFSDDHGLKVISLVGMPGIGKTALARTVFEDQSVASHFQVQGWITVPQKYNDSQMLYNLLLQSNTLSEPYKIIKQITSREVYDCLSYKRYLIVLDDIWTTRHWEDTEQCFPGYEDNGSRVLLTTRSYEVAGYACSLKGTLHVMSLLDPIESWDLFCNVFPLEKFKAPRFEKFRSHLAHVVEKCDGLPQTIVVVADRLSKCDQNTQHELKKIEKELESLGIIDHTALTLIYNELPEDFKVCFLYLGVFPKRSEIQVKTLLKLWIAEGFVKPSNHEELEKKAYWYLKGLTNRSLVLISNRSSDGKIKTCRVHSALHNVCLREAQKEGILCVVNTQQVPRWSLNAFANSCRWLSLYKHSFDYYVLFSSNNPRSIFLFYENPEVFVPFKLLRVLAFVPSSFLQRVPMHLGDLVFLRYLSITQWFDGLDDVLLTNMNLQTLVVSGSDSESQLGAPTLSLPSTIWELPQLRHLELGTSYTVNPPSVVKENLQTLSWVGPSHCKEEVYSSFPKIKKLKIFCKGNLEPGHIGGSSTNHIIFDRLDYLRQLESLTISVSVGCIVTFPERCMFPLELKKLSLSGTNLSEMDLTIIGMLRWLEVLKLENAFHGKVWEVVEGGFYRLRFLLLEAKKLEQLKAYTESFPSLERLVLRSCYCLEEIPSSFGEIFSFQSIELDRCSQPSVVASAKDIQENLKKYFGKTNFEIKIQGPEYNEPGYIIESVEDVGVGNFEKAIFEEPEYDESGHKVESVEDVGVGKFKSYIHKIKKKRWRNLFRRKPA